MRRDYYGLDFTWYARDDGGLLAEFSSGYSPMPSQIFEDEELVDALEAFVQWNGLRERVFVYYETGPMGSDEHARQSLPDDPLTASELAEVGSRSNAHHVPCPQPGRYSASNVGLTELQLLPEPPTPPPPPTAAADTASAPATEARRYPSPSLSSGR